MTVIDGFDVRRSIAAEGLLGIMSDATVLNAADVRTACTLNRLAGGADAEVLLAAALAVRAVRMGHVYVDLATVATTAAPDEDDVEADLSALPWPDAHTWTGLVGASPLTAVGPDGPVDRPLRIIGSRLYLDRYWRHERAVIADLLQRSTSSPPAIDEAVLADGLGRLFGAGDDDDQLRAAATAVRRRLAVVAGGPGTGKTTTVARIVALLHEQADAAGAVPPLVALAAPTGKAAARLAEAVHAEAASMNIGGIVRDALLATQASTLHRLLGWQFGNRSRFRYDGANQLPHGVVIVDETSMVSLSMMARLLCAVRPTARLVLVGDPRQLASVEAGAVLGDIVGPAAALGPAPGAPIGEGIVVLRKVHRFKGGIAAVAEAVESGDADSVISVITTADDDVTWIESDASLDPRHAPELAGVRSAVVDAATGVVEAAQAGDGAGALERLRSVQVLCAHRRGAFGATRWRAEIEHWLRAAIPGYGGGAWYAGRPLLVTENDYGLGVFNGDTGVVVDSGGGRLRAVFERRGGLLSVRPTRLASVESLYAMTIHKAQGSQFGSVVVVLPESTSRVLTRELLYTAVSRAQTSLTLVASEASIRAAVERPVARASGLADALWPARSEL